MGAGSLPIVSELTAEQAATHARGAFVVVVHVFGADHHRRRRVFLTLKAAQAAAERAQDAGHTAHVLLAHLEPIGAVIV